MKPIRKLIRALALDSDEGQGLVEYGLLLALVTVLCFIAFVNFGDSSTGLIQRVANSVGSVS
jgi:Flp pilus assembly pilin Flp